MTENAQPTANLQAGITGRIVKITAAIVTVTALVAAMLSFTEVLHKFVEVFRPRKEVAVVDPKSCLKTQLRFPKAVPLSQWSSMEMRLTGQNECAATLAVYVSFRGRVDRVRLDPPFEAPDPSCWEQKTLPSGAVDWSVSPPRLVLLKAPLGGKVKVDVNWVVYNAETKTQIRADKATFWLEDDPPLAATSTEALAPL